MLRPPVCRQSTKSSLLTDYSYPPEQDARRKTLPVSASNIYDTSAQHADIPRLGIRINTICPGIFPSEMSGSSAAGLMMSSAEKTVRRTPLGRAGKPEEIIGPVLMLSSRAGGYFAGSILAVDGGRLLVSVNGLVSIQR